MSVSQHSENKMIEDNHRPGYEVISSKIIEFITTSHLKTGDRLPTERALSEQLGVSRTMIREAVKLLIAKGIVRSLQGSGLYVESEPSTFAVPTFDFLKAVGPEDVQSFFEFRLNIEIQTARLAAERITHKELLLLQAAVSLNKQGAKAHQLDLFSKSDDDFHCAIAEATRNPFLISTVKTIMRLQYWIVALTIGSIPGSLPIAAEQHEIILSAIQNGQSKDAATAMSVHIETTHANYQLAMRRRLMGDAVIDQEDMNDEA